MKGYDVIVLMSIDGDKATTTCSCDSSLQLDKKQSYGHSLYTFTGTCGNCGKEWVYYSHNKQLLEVKKTGVKVGV